jgi:hypothetical protein
VIGVVDRYLALLELQLLEREMACGDLSEEAEEQFINDLDTCWTAMDSQEVEEVERRFARTREVAPHAPVNLGVEDSLAANGRLPRKAA